VGCGCRATHFLTSELNGGEWSASLPACFPPEEELWTHPTGVQVAPKVRFGHFGEESSILLLSGYKPRIIQPIITIQTTILLETWLNWLRDWRLTCSGYGVGEGDYWAQLVVGRVSGGRVWVWKECTSLLACLTEFPGNYNSPNAVRKISVGRLSTTTIPTPTPLPPTLLQGLCSCPVNWVKEGLVTFAVIFGGTWEQQHQKLALR